jgi:hypothetical protein
VFAQQRARDDEPADDEKDVDTDAAAFRKAVTRMQHENGQCGEGAQAVDSRDFIVCR